MGPGIQHCDHIPSSWSSLPGESSIMRATGWQAVLFPELAMRRKENHCSKEAGPGENVAQGPPSPPPASETRDRSLQTVSHGPTTGWPPPALLTHTRAGTARVPPLLQGTGSPFCPWGPSSATLHSGLAPLGSPLQPACHSLSLPLGSSVQPSHLTVSRDSQQKGRHYLELSASTNNLFPSSFRPPGFHIQLPCFLTASICPLPHPKSETRNNVLEHACDTGWPPAQACPFSDCPTYGNHR